MSLLIALGGAARRGSQMIREAQEEERKKAELKELRAYRENSSKNSASIKRACYKKNANISQKFVPRIVCLEKAKPKKTGRFKHHRPQ